MELGACIKWRDLTRYEDDIHRECMSYVKVEGSLLRREKEDRKSVV